MASKRNHQREEAYTVAASRARSRASPRVLSREELERAAWGDAPPDSDALRAHLHILRNAIDKPFRQPLLQTLRGIGWQLADPNAAPP